MIFLVLLVLVACFNVGWQSSLLVIGAVCCTLYVVYSLIKKSSNKDATENDKRIADLSLKAVVGVSVCLIIVGVILVGVGMITSGVDHELQVCEYCGGVGRLSSGKECWG
jgi:Ca2+/Na+ antiporter